MPTNAKRAAKIRQGLPPAAYPLTASCRRLMVSAAASSLADASGFMTYDAGPYAFSRAQVDRFIQDGFVRIDRAFPPEWAEEARAIMWRVISCDPHDAATWRSPVIRLPGYGGEPFRKAANTPVLHAAFDQLVGKGRWIPRQDLGTFPVRFPHPDDPGDA